VGAFEDDKIAGILELPEYVKPLGVIALGYPTKVLPRWNGLRMNSLCTMNAGN
jgi:nitroreductase